MILFPAIDLKGGACVRLLRGDMASATVFNTDPAAQARAFAATGFEWLHVVDLDGAFAGRSINGDAVHAIRAAVGRDNLVGTQFHPEKSQAAGLRLIANFLKWRP